MCGIFGGVNGGAIASKLLSGLERLEYRGYDSAGLATLEPAIEIRRVEGPVRRLADICKQNPPAGAIGIAHTRWATHGVPAARNAHPHRTGKVAVVHNGIVENHASLRVQLEQAGAVFLSETDSEVIPQLVNVYKEQGLSTADAVRLTADRLEGRFAFAVLSEDEPDRIVAIRKGSPLVVGSGPKAAWLSSDDAALIGLADQVAILEDGDIVSLSAEGVVFEQGNKRPFTTLQGQGWSSASALEGDVTSRELRVQPDAIRNTLAALDRIPLDVDAPRLSRIQTIACGSSHYAAMLARPWFEELAHLPVETTIASELGPLGLHENVSSLAVLVSQSGETADTLAAQALCKQAGCRTVAIVNTPRSQLARDADHQWPTHAGREFGVAATKTFTCQAAALAAMALRLARARARVYPAIIEEACFALEALPEAIDVAIGLEPQIRPIAHALASSKSALFIGRGQAFAAAAEGALKLKELSYIHAEAYPAGELKHGPIAIVEAGLPVIVLAPTNEHRARTVSNLQEVKARGAWTILVTDDVAGDDGGADAVLRLPRLHRLTAPIVQTVLLQMLACETARARGLDVDRPRNLAKSVTVE
jgi:glucosamine--fructose-6-phosphate aminotransferase (isomerizing)